MNSHVLVQAESVSKKFCRDLKKSLWYGVKDIYTELTGRSGSHNHLRSSEFWAVDEIAFELKRGECLGLIGPNGAGKTTLLRMLNGLIKPDKGKITMRGRVGALIALGAGFNPILTGRENVYAAGALLGLSRNEIDSKYDGIVEFSGLSEFMHTPVKSYSSGMQVRLGFSVAAQMNPDVLILDEVLAVGDMGFKARSFNAIKKMSENAAVIYVSHSMPHISRICSKVLLMNRGRQQYFGGDVGKGIELYTELSEQKQPCEVTGSGRATIHDIRFISGTHERNEVKYGVPLIIECDVTVDARYQRPDLAFAFETPDRQTVAQCISHYHNAAIRNSGHRMTVRVDLGECCLAPGTYWLMAGVQGDDFGEILVRYSHYKKLKVVGDFAGHVAVQMLASWEVIDRA